jgi:hypothetical protein
MVWVRERTTPTADFYIPFFGVMRLAWWDFSMDPTKEHRILCKSSKKKDWDPSNDYTSFRGKTHEPCKVHFYKKLLSKKHITSNFIRYIINNFNQNII